MLMCACTHRVEGSLEAKEKKDQSPVNQEFFSCSVCEPLMMLLAFHINNSKTLDGKSKPSAIFFKATLFFVIFYTRFHATSSELFNL